MLLAIPFIELLILLFPVILALLLVPGKPSQIQLTNNTFFTSRQIAKGSKLVFVTRVLIEPGIEINYGTGKTVSQETIADGKKDLIIKWLPESYISLSVE